jgi:ADP-heptose:LPS heptosyltransferase
MLRMKRLRAGMVINPVLSHHVEADEVCAVIQSKYKVGTKINRLSLRGKWCDSYFDRLIEIPINNTTNEIKAITSFTKELVDDSYSYKLSDLSFIYKNYTGVIDGKYCLISLSASVKSRIWPISKVIDVLKKIPISYKIVLTGYGADDKSMAETIINSDSIRHKYVNMVNQTSLIDLICLVSKSSFVLGNDSAIVHIAAACRVPSICYTPGAHFNRFVPYPQDIPEENFHPRCVYFLMECYNCDYYCKYVHKSDDILPCLLNISSEMVINEMSKLLLEIE